MLISAGVNDFVNNKVSTQTLAGHMKDFARHCKQCHPNTKIIFDAISPVSLGYDRHGHLNWNINQFNSMMFDFSVNSSNFKLFDTPAFGLAHLGRDGLHLNPAGKRLLTSSWVNCSLITLGLRQGPLPLRSEFRDRLVFGE